MKLITGVIGMMLLRMSMKIPVALIAQSGERQTEDLKVARSIRA